jgi:hypothetical protein
LLFKKIIHDKENVEEPGETPSKELRIQMLQDQGNIKEIYYFFS